MFKNHHSMNIYSFINGGVLSLLILTSCSIDNKRKEEELLESMEETSMEEVQEEAVEIKVPEDWKLLKENDYSIYYPENWEVGTSSMGNKMIQAPLEGENDDLAENINIKTNVFPEGKVEFTESFAKNVEVGLKDYIDQYEFIRSDIQELDDRHVYTIVYKAYMYEEHLKYFQRYIVKDSKAHILTFVSNEKAYDDYAKTVEQIMDTFEPA